MISSVFSEAEHKAQSEAVPECRKEISATYFVFSRVQLRKAFAGVVELSRAVFSPMHLYSSVEFNIFWSLVEHIELMCVGVVELIQTYFSWMQLKCGV